jgi:hypothetical protein
MTEVLGVLLGSFVAIVVPLSGWIQKRVTKEGRLIRRLEILGDACGKLPDSAERKALEGHLLRVAEELNEWLNPANRPIRRIQSAASWVSATLGVVAVVILVPIVGTNDPVGSLLLGVAIGTAIALVVLPLAALAAFIVSKRLAKTEEQARIAADEARLEALGAAFRQNGAST